MMSIYAGGCNSAAGHLVLLRARWYCIIAATQYDDTGSNSRVTARRRRCLRKSGPINTTLPATTLLLDASMGAAWRMYFFGEQESIMALGDLPHFSRSMNAAQAFSVRYL